MVQVVLMEIVCVAPSSASASKLDEIVGRIDIGMILWCVGATGMMTISAISTIWPLSRTTDPRVTNRVPGLGHGKTVWTSLRLFRYLEPFAITFVTILVTTCWGHKVCWISKSASWYSGMIGGGRLCSGNRIDYLTASGCRDTM